MRTTAGQRGATRGASIPSLPNPPSHRSCRRTPAVDHPARRRRMPTQPRRPVLHSRPRRSKSRHQSIRTHGTWPATTEVNHQGTAKTCSEPAGEGRASSERFDAALARLLGAKPGVPGVDTKPRSGFPPGVRKLPAGPTPPAKELIYAFAPIADDQEFANEFHRRIFEATGPIKRAAMREKNENSWASCAKPADEHLRQKQPLSLRRSSQPQTGAACEAAMKPTAT